MSFLDEWMGRVLGGADLRRAVEAEAGGNYLEAARAYAAAGESHKVAEMHLLASERAPTPDDKLDCLREAARWSEGDEEPAKKVRRRVANALLGWVRARGLITESDRRVVEEAAQMFLAAGDAPGAGDCHELLGASEAAAQAYQAAGEVDRLEQLLDGEAARRRRDVVVSDSVEDHRMRLRAGDPAGALASLASAIVAADAKDRIGLTALRDALAARRVLRRLVLVSEGRRSVVTAPPVTLGRGEDCTLPLRDGGVSRVHAELRREADAWVLADRGSKNGTTLNGLVIAEALPLPAAGELGIGDRCAISFTIDDQVLRLTLSRGLDVGLALHASDGPIAIPTPGSARLFVRFVEGRARARSEGGPLYLNGVHEAGEIEPLVGDVLELAGMRWQASA